MSRARYRQRLRICQREICGAHRCGFQAGQCGSDADVEIVKFVEASEIESVYFETPYHLVPQKRDEKGYALLREILIHNEKVAIANVVICTRQYMATHSKRYPEEREHTTPYARMNRGARARLIRTAA